MILRKNSYLKLIYLKAEFTARLSLIGMVSIKRICQSKSMLINSQSSCQAKKFKKNNNMGIEPGACILCNIKTEKEYPLSTMGLIKEVHEPNKVKLI